MWLPIFNEEWDGDVPVGPQRTHSPQRDAEKGTVTFKAKTLPWITGTYEVNAPRTHRHTYCELSPHLQVRYHHDGKYNVLSMDGPIEIYGEPYVQVPTLGG